MVTLWPPLQQCRSLAPPMSRPLTPKVPMVPTFISGPGNHYRLFRRYPASQTIIPTNGSMNIFIIIRLTAYARYYIINAGTILAAYLLHKLGVDNEFKISVFMGNVQPPGHALDTNGGTFICPGGWYHVTDRF